MSTHNERHAEVMGVLREIRDALQPSPADVLAAAVSGAIGGSITHQANLHVAAQAQLLTDEQIKDITMLVAEVRQMLTDDPGMERSHLNGRGIDRLVRHAERLLAHINALATIDKIEATVKAWRY